MMIDLWWPWWATTLVAVAVVAACAVALLRVRRPAARGALALLAVQGVVLAALAPFVMDDSSMDSALGKPLTREEYARRADDNCRRFGEFAATLGNPTTLPGIATQLERLLPALWRAIGEQALLLPQADEGAAAMQWMSAMARYGDRLEQLQVAAEAGDQAGVKTTSAQLEADGSVAARLSADLGMRICFS